MTTPARFRRHLPGLALLVMPAVLAACDSLLDVEAPGRVASTVLDDPNNAALLVGGARAGFGCAFQAYVDGAAELTDEEDDTQLAAGAWDWDRRGWVGAIGEAFAEASCDNTSSYGVYRPIQTARFSADDAVTRLARFTDAQVSGRVRLLAQANLLKGYTRIVLGEGFCSSAFDLGAELAPAAVLTQAEQVFTEAIAAAAQAGDASVTNAARLGRARARRDLARLPNASVNAAKYAEAEADAQAIPAGFVYQVQYNANATFSRNNLAARNRNLLLHSVGPNYRNLNDPRVVVTNSGQIGVDAVNVVWVADKYAGPAAPIALARYEEARLIIAESQLAAGNTAAAIGTLNALRGRAGVGLPAYGGATDPASVTAFLLSERSKELFLEGQRFWDINRFALPLTPPVGAAYPGKGGTYANLRCLPLPDIERINNPNLGN